MCAFEVIVNDLLRRRVTRSAATISAKGAGCESGPSFRRSTVKPGKITRKSASRHM
jgi:hypothetical protein